MKVVINRCFGGFNLSPKAVARMAELCGVPVCFFVQEHYKGPYVKVDVGNIPQQSMSWRAYKTPEPPRDPTTPEWKNMTQEQRVESNRHYEEACLTSCPEKRDDSILVQVVEELGEAADGFCAKLKVVEIPDGVEYTIEEYDGYESIHEQHRSWP